MRYPNTRYGNPTELQYYTQGLTIKQIAKQLRRSEKSVSEWINGGRKIPFWVPELLRLRHMESQMKLRQMGIADYRERLGVVKGEIIEFPTVIPSPNHDRENAQPKEQVLHHQCQLPCCNGHSDIREDGLRYRTA